MNTRKIIVESNDGTKFTVEIWGRSDAQLAMAERQERRYANSKTTEDLLAHGDFLLYSELIDSAVQETGTCAETQEQIRRWRERSQLHLVTAA
jgi:hypothetical protein